MTLGAGERGVLKGCAEWRLELRVWEGKGFMRGRI